MRWDCSTRVQLIWKIFKIKDIGAYFRISVCLPFVPLPYDWATFSTYLINLTSLLHFRARLQFYFLLQKKKIVMELGYGNLQTFFIYFLLKATTQYQCHFLNFA